VFDTLDRSLLLLQLHVWQNVFPSFCTATPTSGLFVDFAVNNITSYKVEKFENVYEQLTLSKASSTTIW